jgi:ribosomal-protein-alanine N-acetyltransferase
MHRAFLVGPRVYLRRLEDADVSEEYLAWLNDPDVTRYLETGRTPSSVESIRQFLRRFDGSTTDFIFAIVERRTDRHVGNITLNRISATHRTADTGLMIGRKDARGKGYAREAWALVAGYAFARLGLRKLIAGVVDGNVASQMSLEKLGFKVEGRLRQEYWVDGMWRDYIRLGLFREEFTPELRRAHRTRSSHPRSKSR